MLNLKTEKGVQAVTDYYAMLHNEIKERETSLGDQIAAYLSACERGEDPVLRDSDGKVVGLRELAEKFYYFHYSISPISGMVLVQPANHEEKMKVAILEGMRLLVALGIPFEKPSRAVQEWLDAD